MYLIRYINNSRCHCELLLRLIADSARSGFERVRLFGLAVVVDGGLLHAQVVIRTGKLESSLKRHRPQGTGGDTS